VCFGNAKAALGVAPTIAARKTALIWRSDPGVIVGSHVAGAAPAVKISSVSGMSNSRESKLIGFALPRSVTPYSAAFHLVCATPSVALPQIFRGRWRAPDVVRRGAPHFRHLRMVAVPWPRLEVAELFVEHFIELGEHLDDLVVGIAMVGIDVVSRPV